MRLVEKYRPKSFDEIIGQDKVIKSIKAIIEENRDLPHMMFIGPPGSGKTSTAECIARAIWKDDWKNHIEEFNASDERGIDTIRNKIKRLALTKGKRIIFLDEADALTVDAQQALRRIMEKSVDSTFILSVNNDYKIIDPIKSRCVIYVFERLKEKDIAKKILEICKNEGIEINEEAKKGLVVLVKEAKGDLRKAINMLEKVISNGQINIQSVIALAEPETVGKSLQLALQGDFTTAKELIQEAYLQVRDPDKIIQKLYEEIDKINDTYIKTNLFIRLANLENTLKFGTNPVIQLIGFIAYAWVLPNIPRECPLAKR